MKVLLVWLVPAIAALGVILAFVAACSLWPGLAYKANIVTQGADAAAALFIVAVFLERSLAVINSILFGQQEKQIEAQLAAALRGEPDFAVAADLEKQLAVLDAWKERLRVGLGFIFAVGVSAAGARTLTALLALPGSKDQLYLFTAIDILLTAGLLAGGSNGIAMIIEILKKQATTTLARLRAELRAMGRPA